MNDYNRYVGRRVNVRFSSGESEIVIEGPLTGVSEELLTVEARGGRAIDIPVAELREVRGAVDFGGRRE
jgi:ribosome maturation factor RimP